MKKKDLMYLLLAVAIFLVSGYVGYTQVVAPKKASSKMVTVEKIGIIPNQLDPTTVSQLGSSTVQDFSPAVDLNGLGNTAPFGP